MPELVGAGGTGVAHCISCVAFGNAAAERWRAERRGKFLRPLLRPRSWSGAEAAAEMPPPSSDTVPFGGDMGRAVLFCPTEPRGGRGVLWGRSCVGLRPGGCRQGSQSPPLGWAAADRQKVAPWWHLSWCLGHRGPGRVLFPGLRVTRCPRSLPWVPLGAGSPSLARDPAPHGRCLGGCLRSCRFVRGFGCRRRGGKVQARRSGPVGEALPRGQRAPVHGSCLWKLLCPAPRPRRSGACPASLLEMPVAGPADHRAVVRCSASLCRLGGLARLVSARGARVPVPARACGAAVSLGARGRARSLAGFSRGWVLGGCWGETAGAAGGAARAVVGRGRVPNVPAWGICRAWGSCLPRGALPWCWEVLGRGVPACPGAAAVSGERAGLQPLPRVLPAR